MKTGTSQAQRFRVCAAVQNINKAKYLCSEWQQSRPWLERGRRGIMREKCHTKLLMFKSALALPFQHPRATWTDTHTTVDGLWFVCAAPNNPSLPLLSFYLSRDEGFNKNWSHFNMCWWESPTICISFSHVQFQDGYRLNPKLMLQRLGFLQKDHVDHNL